jgi:lysine 2,3-aminomutase
MYCFVMKRDRNSTEWNDWRWQLRNAVGFDELAALFPGRGFSGCRAADALFPVKITPYYLELLRREIGTGPLSRMTLPDPAELESGGCCADPFDETGSARRCRGVRQRFPDRILVMTSRDCAVNCRFCTRKGLLNGADLASADAIDAIVRYVRASPEVREVLLSGGDPLVLPDETVLAYVSAFAEIEQIDAVRLCTRMPVTLPARITPALAGGLARSGKLWLNTHFNHSSEITAEAAAACRLLAESGIPVSNQSVLLKDVNDSTAEMLRLCAALQRMRVRPYYVFQCDPVAGIGHFRVARERAVTIERELAERIGGLALPRFVMDVPGSPRKLPLGDCAVPRGLRSGCQPQSIASA